jgi:D-arabinose 1-dehydrogenase-like Zn-dependent alcohol dehydrogenase
MGHEYVGVVEQAGREVRIIKPGDFVIGSFLASDNTCEICQAGYQSRCAQVEFVGAGGAGCAPTSSTCSTSTALIPTSPSRTSPAR